MTPISALAILFCIYAVSELIAQKTKAIFSTVLSIAILLLAGFWSGILPRTLIDDAQITGFGNIIAGLLIVSLGTTIDFAELRRQWKVVVTALCGVCGAVAAIVLIGRPFIGSEMAIAGAPIFAGGSAATLIRRARQGDEPHDGSDVLHRALCDAEVHRRTDCLSPAAAHSKAHPR
ncbi:MAG: hypothetical protein ACLVB4_04960 [Butyricicoccus sp.]